jgi:hypothetical protein
MKFYSPAEVEKTFLLTELGAAFGALAFLVNG